MKIVVAHGMEMVEEAIAMMREVASVVIPRDGSEETLLAEVRDADVLLIGINPPAGRRLIASAGNLKHIARMGVGVDSVDLKAATEHGVMVTNVPDVTSDTVAEFTMTLLLSLARNIPRCDRAVREGRWNERLDLISINTELYGKTHGIVGLGRIGGRVALRCKAFGMKVIYHKRTRDLDFEKSQGVEYVPFETLLREADSISLHTPLTDQTRNLMGRPQFEAMKRTALLINQSRGKVVNEKALIAGPQRGAHRRLRHGRLRERAARSAGRAVRLQERRSDPPSGRRNARILSAGRLHDRRGRDPDHPGRPAQTSGQQGGAGRRRR